MPQNKSRVYIIIPARYDSTRFPGKPLALIAGKTMLERVWRIAEKSALANDCYVATDDYRIRDTVLTLNAKPLMTPQSCANGTERVYAATKSFAQPDDIIVCLQGDAVLTPPWVIDELIQTLQEKDNQIEIATPAQALTDSALIQFIEHKKISPSSGTTVTFDLKGKALYFSKQIIPYSRKKDATIYRHIGLYAYRFRMLEKLQGLPSSPLEEIEKLEQLRALENNLPIQVVICDYKGRTHASVDTPEDVPHAEEIIAREGELI